MCVVLCGRKFFKKETEEKKEERKRCRVNKERQMKKKRGILRMQPAGYQVEGDRGSV